MQKDENDLVKLRDNDYFDGYSNIEIHEEMLADTARVEAYKNALNLTASGKVVIDVGAGTGVLSILAADAGALKVFAVENSGIIETCK